MKIDMVNPIPATVPTTTICGQVTPGDSTANRSFVASREKARMPNGFPSTRPAPGAADAEVLQGDDHHDACAQDDEAHRRQAGRVEDCDDEDCAHVIDDGQREQKDPQGWRHTLSQQGENADRERDVGGRRDAPPPGGGMPEVERREDARRNSADGGRQRKGSSPRLAELTSVNLPMDLESNDEEEDRHHAVVDPEVQISLEGERTELHAEGEVPKRAMALAPGRIRPGECDRGGGEKKDSARGLDGQEPFDGGKRAPGHSAGWRPAAGWTLGPGSRGLVPGISHASPRSGRRRVRS